MLGHFRRRWVDPLASLKRIYEGCTAYGVYLSAWSRYASLPDAEDLRFKDSYPCLFDKTASTNFDSHYFFQSAWALRLLIQSPPSLHIDIGSQLDFVGAVSAIAPVVFVDIRPPRMRLENVTVLEGSITSLPFPNDSVSSLSCLHVAEHIGLGRYGDELDPSGTRKAASELSRVLAPGGRLLFSVPIGKPRVCFNAHRIHSSRQITDYFSELTLSELSGVDDQGEFERNTYPARLDGGNYSCGFFLFQKS